MLLDLFLTAVMRTVIIYDDISILDLAKRQLHWLHWTTFCLIASKYTRCRLLLRCVWPSSAISCCRTLKDRYMPRN